MCGSQIRSDITLEKNIHDDTCAQDGYGKIVLANRN